VDGITQQVLALSSLKVLAPKPSMIDAVRHTAWHRVCSRVQEAEPVHLENLRLLSWWERPGCPPNMSCTNYFDGLLFSALLI